MYVREFRSDPRAREKPCIRCGLSLRKHLDDRYCPDCGLSVWMSLNANDALDYSNANWLRKASRGAWVMSAIQTVALVAYVVALVGIATSTAASVGKMTAAARHQAHRAGRHAPAAAATQPASQPTSQPAETSAADGAEWEGEEDRFDSGFGSVAPGVLSAAAGLSGLYFVLQAGGLVLLTPHEQRYPDRAKSMRTAARVAAVISGLVGLGLLALAARTLHSGTGPNAAAAWGLMLLVEIVFAGCAFCCWLWLRPIARRAGKSSLARLCGYLLFLPVLPFLKAAPFLGLYLFYLVAPLLHFLPVIYIPLSVYLFARFALLLRQAVPHAEAAWAAETKPVGAAATNAAAAAATVPAN
jgi:hypothetical protein